MAGQERGPDIIQIHTTRSDFADEGEARYYVERLAEKANLVVDRSFGKESASGWRGVADCHAPDPKGIVGIPGAPRDAR